MSDAQIALLITAITAGLGAIAAAIRWGISRAAKSLDHNTDTMSRVIERNSDAMVENTSSNAILSTKIDGIAQFLFGAPDEGQPGALPVAVAKVKKTRTPAKGTPVRPNTHGDE